MTNLDFETYMKKGFALGVHYKYSTAQLLQHKLSSSNLNPTSIQGDLLQLFVEQQQSVPLELFKDIANLQSFMMGFINGALKK